ncbi:MAG: hypothetical protein Q8O29_05450 [Polaromonas sp.]|uniref:hypothetical protein n=1 Tax=Polaromonas sp. TaxID=1869339 RepID=UPI002735D684|nr:hypothetical protein [Polaromonas sp.]MDP2817716.1 hypothetical protein [Polaromonas sp.]
MVHCFLTGVQFPLEDGFVLSRREAHDLLYVLNDRAASLKRVIDQFSPLDGAEGNMATDRLSQGGGVARRKHRLVCKAVADALAPGFPEIKLFLAWPEYHSRALLRRNPAHNYTTDSLAVPVGADDENKCGV